MMPDILCVIKYKNKKNINVSFVKNKFNLL